MSVIYMIEKSLFEFILSNAGILYNNSIITEDKPYAKSLETNFLPFIDDSSFDCVKKKSIKNIEEKISNMSTVPSTTTECFKNKNTSLVPAQIVGSNDKRGVFMKKLLPVM